MVWKRNSSEPSGAFGPKALGGSCVALQQMPTRSHERTRREALASYLVRVRLRVRVRVTVRVTVRVRVRVRVTVRVRVKVRPWPRTGGSTA